MGLCASAQPHFFAEKAKKTLYFAAFFAKEEPQANRAAQR